MKPITFTPPKNCNDAQKRSDTLLVKILTLQRQLGDHYTRQDYHAWRQRVIYALDLAILERQYLKRYNEDNNRV